MSHLKEASNNPCALCPSCGTQLNGKFCSNCGEKIFHPDDLSLKKFLAHVVDVFTHVDSKFIKSVKYLLFKPGFLTYSYITGARVKYGKPAQIFLLSNLFFYFVTHSIGATDYTPNYGDHHFFFLSSYHLFGWLAPLDNAIVAGIDYVGSWKQSKLKLSEEQFIVEFLKSSWFFSKLFVVFLIPLYALVFWLFLSERLNYFGAAMVMATHVVSFQLILYSVHSIVAHGLEVRWFEPIIWLLFETPLSYLSNFLFNNTFEMTQMIIWIGYLFFAFQAIRKANPILTFILAFLVAKIVFFVTFGIYKKILILVTTLLM